MWGRIPARSASKGLPYPLLAPRAGMKVSLIGDNWQSALPDSTARGPRAKPQPVNLDDPQILLALFWDQWNAVFKNTLGHAERSIVSELRDVRNHWAHNEQFSSNDAIRALDSMERLLNAVSAAEAGAEVGQMRMDLMRTMFDDQRRQEMRKKSVQPTEGKPHGALKPWREVVTPHPDVASGRRFSWARRFHRESRTRNRTAPRSGPSGARSPGNWAARKAINSSRKTTRRPRTRSDHRRSGR